MLPNSCPPPLNTDSLVQCGETPVSELLSSQPLCSKPCVQIVIGTNVDDSALPSAHDRNRFAVDLVYHYACAPFLRGSALLGMRHRTSSAVAPSSALLPTNSLWGCSTPFSDSPQFEVAADTPMTRAEASRIAAIRDPLRTLPAPSAARLSGVAAQVPLAEDSLRPGSGISARQPLKPPIYPTNSDIFLWNALPLPPITNDEVAVFHDEQYIQYLRVRESLSALDESRPSSCAAVRSSRLGSGQPSPPSPGCLSRGSHRSGDPGVSHLPGFPSARLMPRSLPFLTELSSDVDYGLTDDAAPFVGLWRTIQATTSGSLVAARWLAPEETGGSMQLPPPSNDGKGAAGARGCQFSASTEQRFAAIHWFGGRHAARRHTAARECFFNDVVLAAMTLRRRLPAAKNRVLIVDLDAHHGDGTQVAFFSDPHVLTLSVHAYYTSKAPQTGMVEESGVGFGKGMCMNLPLPEGCTDHVMVPLMRSALRSAVQRLGEEQVGAVIVLCSANGLQGDPEGRMNYTIAGLQCVVRLALSTAAGCAAKVLLLGGGGNVNTSAARLWAILTRDVLSWATVRLQQSSSSLTVSEETPFSAAASHSPCSEASRSVELDYFSLSPVLGDLAVPVPENSAFFAHYGPSFLMYGLPSSCAEPRKHLRKGEDELYAVWEAVHRAMKQRKSQTAKEPSETLTLPPITSSFRRGTST